LGRHRCVANPAPVAGPRCEDAAGRWPASSVSWPDPQSLLARSADPERRPSNGFAPHLRRHNRGPAERVQRRSEICSTRKRPETCGSSDPVSAATHASVGKQRAQGRVRRSSRSCACCTPDPEPRFPAASNRVAEPHVSGRSPRVKGSYLLSARTRTTYALTSRICSGVKFALNAGMLFRPPATV
jgi:hypothetical protein